MPRTTSALLASVGSHEILHFGGHAVVNRDFPLLSYLLMTPERRVDTGLLYAHQLYDLRFNRTRLAVLAACDTATGPIHGEGPLSLSRALLAAGAPAVVASLWNVDDAETARLFQIFYTRLAEGEDGAAALRHAQLALLHAPGSHGPSTTWAAFELFGSFSGATNQKGRVSNEQLRAVGHRPM